MITPKRSERAVSYTGHPACSERMRRMYNTVGETSVLPSTIGEVAQDTEQTSRAARTLRWLLPFSKCRNNNWPWWPTFYSRKCPRARPFPSRASLGKVACGCRKGNPRSWLFYAQSALNLYWILLQYQNHTLVQNHTLNLHYFRVCSRQHAPVKSNDHGDAFDHDRVLSVDSACIFVFSIL